jgi:hypothetical protein
VVEQGKHLYWIVLYAEESQTGTPRIVWLFYSEVWVQDQPVLVDIPNFVTSPMESSGES